MWWPRVLSSCTPCACVQAAFVERASARSGKKKKVRTGGRARAAAVAEEAAVRCVVAAQREPRTPLKSRCAAARVEQRIV